MTLTKILKQAKSLLSTIKLSEILLDDGKTTIQFDGESIEVGSVIYVQDSSGNWPVIADGTYKTESGIEFTVVEGVVSAVSGEQPKEEEAVEETKEVKQEEAAVETVATIDIAKLVDEKLQPVWQSIADIKNIIESNKSLSEQTQSALSKISDAVAVLSKQPAAKAIEEKEITGIKKVDKKVEDSRAYKILHS